MNNLLRNMNIERVILHKIYQRTKNEDIINPTYSNSLTILDRYPLLTFRQRVIQALGSDSHSIEMEIFKKTPSSTYDYVRKIFNEESDTDNNNFIEISKMIALNLAQSQTRIKIPGGIIVIFSGTTGTNNDKFIGIMKAETQEGFTLNNENEILSLNLVEELFLTPQQKLYKIGLFIKQENTEDKCLVYDSNLGKSKNSEAAKYFYESFLGCTQNKNSKILTKQFFTETQSYINSCDNLSQEDKIKLNDALYTYISVDQSTTISSFDFAERYLSDDNDKDDYLNHMNNNIRFPENNISKDISLINKSLENKNIYFFGKDIKFTYPTNKYTDSISIEEDGEDTIIRIKGKVSSQS